MHPSYITVTVERCLGDGVVTSWVARVMMAELDAESVRTESQGGEEPYVAEFSREQLLEVTRLVSDALSTLKSETEMFEKFYKRLDPKDLSPMRSRRRSKSRSTISERLLSLSVDQKLELALREMEDSKEEAQRDAEIADRILQSFKATMEEAEIRSTEIKKAMYEFERDIGKAAMSGKKGGGVTPEKVLRYVEEKTRARDSLVDKLRLKNAALKIQKKKLQMQLKQKEEMGEVLNEVDFQQLKIENAQFLERIDKRNQDLLQLKLNAGETLQVLNSYKKKLHHTTTESTYLRKEISARNDMLQRIEQETQQVEQERAKAESLNKKLRKQLSDYRVPDVLNYVHEKMEQEELEKSIRAWERKVEIAEGSKMELPLWLVKGLYDNKRRIISVELPKIYREGWRTVFSADANVVDLHKMGPHYYSFGSQLLNFDSPENTEIAQTLLQTFIGRFRRIMDSSQNAYNEDTSGLVAKLDELERLLFRAGQEGLNAFQNWERGQAAQIRASSLVQSYKKRKFHETDT
ncbi:hypothetical protein AB205_0070630 [Aquarana catesbeiana]|uniref:Cilia- and flagella-associated protein 263 n=1 Tax=Aquarana catesbeiana TaxID=8400 RepID=A0A2G9S2H5_AQUCT|nr:hypothetical protein AB205_0070630 [Aquarana catesbeiana]